MMYRTVIFILLCFTLAPVYVNAGQVNAFIYHRFDDNRYPSTNISIKIFEEQLRYLQQKNLPTVSTRNISERIAKGESLPEHAVMLTVDDAYRSFYEVALPVIRQYEVAVSLFVNTDAVGTAGYMTWEEIREAAAAGVEIGNHTASHAYLVELEDGETYQHWRERVRSDILKAQTDFERELGFRPKIFAYPYGEYSTEVVSLLQELDFVAAYAQQSGVIHEEHDPFILPRFPMGGPFATLDDFKSKAAMHPLRVANQQPFDPVIYKTQENPPILVLQLPELAINVEQLNCFVQGNNHCRVEVIPEKGEGWYQVVAEEPLSGRRNKYTLTGQAPDGGWFWFSQLWLNATNPVSKAN